MSGTDPEEAVAREEAEIERLEARWLALGLSTAPADRPAAERAIADLYRAAGLAPPEGCLWAPSPLQGAAAATMAQFLSPWMPAQVRDAEWGREMDRTDSEALRMVRDAIARHRGEEAWAPLPSHVRRAIHRGLPTLADYISTRHGNEAADRAPIGAWLRRRFGAEEGARLAARVERMHETLYAGPILDLVWALERSVGRHFWVERNTHQSGHLDAPRAAVGEYLLGRIGATHPLRDAMVRLAESCGWWWPYRGAVILSERPRRLGLDARGRLHSGDGPAIEYPDGWGVYVWHGQEVPERLIMRPETIRVAEVLAQANVEIRRLVLERMGYARFILESGARPVNADETGTLYRIELPHEEPLVLVHVINATPEPDGSRRRYFLRVPPRMERARQAVAWSFGLPERQYGPARET